MKSNASLIFLNVITYFCASNYHLTEIEKQESSSFIQEKEYNVFFFVNLSKFQKNGQRQQQPSDVIHDQYKIKTT